MLFFKNSSRNTNLPSSYCYALSFEIIYSTCTVELKIYVASIYYCFNSKNNCNKNIYSAFT